MMKNIDTERFIGYFVVITTSESKYCVEFPDLLGCFSQGNSLEEAVCLARESLAIYYAEKEGQLPPASSLATIKEKNPNSIIQMVALDTENYMVKPMRTVNKTLTIPEWLNKLAEKYQVNFSQILRNALISHLKDLESISSYDRKMLRD